MDTAWMDSDYYDYDARSVRLCGGAIMALTFLFFSVVFHFLVTSKILPAPENRVMQWVKQDEYYCLLVPLLVPVLIISVYLNWLSMKFFRHTA